MRNLFGVNRCGPIGLDFGSRSLKLLQFNADRSKLLAAARWEIPLAEVGVSQQSDEQLVEMIHHLHDAQNFRGRDVSICLGARELFIQNIRIPKGGDENLDLLVRQEINGRLPFDVKEADIRHLTAGDVRHGEVVKREVIVLACHRPVLERRLAVVQEAGLRPVCVDVEPLALLRCFRRQNRRDEDNQQCVMLVHMGASNTSVVIARGGDVLFIKYIEVGGRQLDESVARYLKKKLTDAMLFRRHNGERRSGRRNPEIEKTIAESTRPVIDRLANELSLCMRYHSVTFRGQPLQRVILSGGEATSGVRDAIGKRMNQEIELGDPLRDYEHDATLGRSTQWDVAAGVALRELARV